MTILYGFLVYALLLSLALAAAGYRSRAVTLGMAPRERPKRILVVGSTGERVAGWSHRRSSAASR